MNTTTTFNAGEQVSYDTGMGRMITVTLIKAWSERRNGGYIIDNLAQIEGANRDGQIVRLTVRQRKLRKIGGGL